MNSNYALLKTAILLLVFSIYSGLLDAQNVSVTDDESYSPESSAMLDVKSTDKGMLIPRVTTAQRNAISAPAEGLFVYDTDEKHFYYYDGTNWVDMPTKNIRSTDTSVTISKQLIFEGDAVVWDDLKVPVTATRNFGAKEPLNYVFANDGNGSQGVYLWYFSPSQEQELFFTVQLPHSYKEGTDIEPHIHWTPYNEVSTSGDVVWGLEYIWANIGDEFNYTTITSGTASVTPTIKHSMCDLGTMDGSGKTRSSMIVCRVFRDATNSSDTYDDWICLLEIDFHFQKSTLGTTSEY